jgi:hypothetical protein
MKFIFHERKKIVLLLYIGGMKIKSFMKIVIYMIMVEGRKSAPCTLEGRQDLGNVKQEHK